jgi:hypothetical protein
LIKIAAQESTIKAISKDKKLPLEGGIYSSVILANNRFLLDRRSPV